MGLLFNVATIALALSTNATFAQTATDFANADTSKVSLGTKVTLKEGSGEKLVYTILGAWDSDLSKGIISYQTAVARALLNHTVGERIELFTDEGAIRQVVIEKIEPHQIDLSTPA